MAGFNVKDLMNIRAKKNQVNAKNKAEKEKSGVNENTLFTNKDGVVDSYDRNKYNAEYAKEDRRRREESAKKYSVDGIDVDVPEMGITISNPTTRNTERETASAIFNSGKKKQSPARIKRESSPVIDFEMLASRGYAQPEISSRPGEDMPNPMAKEQPKQRLGKDLLYAKSPREKSDELEVQKTISEPAEIDERLLASFKDTAQYEGARYEDPKIQSQFEEWKASNAPKETKAPSYDDLWANASDEDKAKFAELLAQQKN